MKILPLYLLVLVWPEDYRRREEYHVAMLKMGEVLLLLQQDRRKKSSPACGRDALAMIEKG